MYYLIQNADKFNLYICCHEPYVPDDNVNGYRHENKATYTVFITEKSILHYT